MLPVSEVELGEISGQAGIGITSTGELDISLPDNASITITTGSGAVLVDNIEISNDCNITNAVDHDNNSGTADQKNPMTINVGTAVDRPADNFSDPDYDPCIPGGTGYIKIGLPSASLSASSWKFDMKTTNATGGNEAHLFEIGSSLKINIIQGEITVFPH